MTLMQRLTVLLNVTHFLTCRAPEVVESLRVRTMSKCAYKAAPDANAPENARQELITLLQRHRTSYDLVDRTEDTPD